MKKIVLISLLAFTLSLIFASNTQAADCTLTGVSFTPSSVKVGEAVTLTVTGNSGCNGYGVSVDIYEYDIGTNGQYIRSVSGVLNISYLNSFAAKINFAFTTQDYLNGGIGGTGEVLGEQMYFIAKQGTGAAGSQVRSLSMLTLDDDIVTGKSWGCIAADDRYACSPGGKPDCSDVKPDPTVCVKSLCMQIDTSKCGQLSTNQGGNVGVPPGPVGQSLPYKFSITNPIKAQTLGELVDALTGWIFAIAIPIAVAMFLYGGFLFLTAGARPGNVEKGKKVMTYAALGLAIILIGSGFIDLIESILDLGSSSG